MRKVDSIWKEHSLRSYITNNSFILDPLFEKQEEDIFEFIKGALQEYAENDFGKNFKSLIWTDFFLLEGGGIKLPPASCRFVLFSESQD